MTGEYRSLAAAVDDQLASGLDDGVYEGAAAAVGTASGVDHLATVGTETGDDTDPVTDGTRFDVASLTKPVVTATVALRLIERGQFDLEATLDEYVDAATGTERGDIPVRTLLTHTSGLPPYKSFPFGWESSEALLASLYDSPLSLLAEPDEWFVYSDLNFVHLADALRHATGESLVSLAETHVFNPAGMDGATLGSLANEHNGDELEGIAATRDVRWRERRLRGEIHDYIGSIMDGESGNAGLFATVADLARFAQALLDDGRGTEGQVLTPSTVQLLRRDAIPHLERPHGLGWRLAHEGQPSPTWSPTAYGHTGFTGTSLWLDPERDQFAVLLTNSLLTDATSDALAAFRRRFHGAVAGADDDTQTQQ